MRVTVKFQYPNEPERNWHLSEEKAQRFVEKVTSEGATARIVPFEMGADLRAMLNHAGVNVDVIR